MSEATDKLTSRALVPLSAPKRYLSQLCKHFQHKIPVTLAEDSGRIEFNAGVCLLDIPDGSDTLRLVVVASDRDKLAMLEDVVGRHLLRFTFRETVDLRWRREA